jgi:hypothetical protein
MFAIGFVSTGQVSHGKVHRPRLQKRHNTRHGGYRRCDGAKAVISTGEIGSVFFGSYIDNMEGIGMESVVGLIIILALTVVLFLVFRAIVLWYWRVNEVVTLLKSIDEKLGRTTPRAP